MNLLYAYAMTTINRLGTTRRNLGAISPPDHGQNRESSLYPSKWLLILLCAYRGSIRDALIQLGLVRAGLRCAIWQLLGQSVNLSKLMLEA